MIVILDKPQMGENIGAVARSMANFGYRQLRIVNPRDGWPNEVAIKNATFASHIIESAKLYDDLSDALSDLDFVIGTYGRDIAFANKDIVTSRNIKDYIDNHAPKKLGILFGCERVGLNNEELSMCSAIVSIPTDFEFKSLNISHAAAIILYELSNISKLDIPEISELATNSEIKFFIDNFEIALDNSGFFKEKNKKPSMMLNITNMIHRMHPSKQEIQTLIGIIKSLFVK